MEDQIECFRGHHISQTFWTPAIGEQLMARPGCTLINQYWEQDKLVRLLTVCTLNHQTVWYHAFVQNRLPSLINLTFCQIIHTGYC